MVELESRGWCTIELDGIAASYEEKASILLTRCLTVVRLLSDRDEEAMRATNIGGLVTSKLAKGIRCLQLKAE